ncbi:mannose-1-phosphate guanylyltransferase [Flavobacterium suzhouense]|uniref:Mannose-1-phosphate guanylyltransferase n=1 Tax=Flavobacterium suzhouense TaxID=1529638 RepID=A0ABW5NQT7_9FLAO
MAKIVHVILSGGVGSRLWPLSRKSKPKQYLELFDGMSLFEMALKRNTNIASRVIVVGNKDNCHLSKSVLDDSKVDYIDIVEAIPRNTAAAIAFAAFASDKEDVLIITPSDHIIQNQGEYQNAINQAIEKARENYLVTFGIKPLKPETGYGYIEFNNDEVLSFREKPNHVTAQEFLDRGNFLWNSGMFCFKAGVFLKELRLFEPKIYETALKAWENNNEGILDETLSRDIPSISIDYAVMERSKKIKVVSSGFEWSDLGSFESVYDYLASQGYPIDESGNMVIGTPNYTSFIGLRNTIFIATPDANLILQKEHSQEVKNVYGYLEKHLPELLN